MPTRARGTRKGSAYSIRGSACRGGPPPSPGHPIASSPPAYGRTVERMPARCRCRKHAASRRSSISEPVAREAQIGQFRADLLCRDRHRGQGGGRLCQLYPRTTGISARADLCPRAQRPQTGLARHPVPRGFHLDVLVELNESVDLPTASPLCEIWYRTCPRSRVDFALLDHFWRFPVFRPPHPVMPGLVPGIHAGRPARLSPLAARCRKTWADARNKSGHDDRSGERGAGE